MSERQFNTLQALLTSKAHEKTRDWWQAYVKDSAPFLGVKMADIRSTVHDWHTREIAGRFENEEQVGLALGLISRQFAEEKLAGILLLQEILLPAGALSCERHLDRFAGLFSPQGIYDWNICDWFCMKVLGHLIETEGLDCARRIATWRRAEDLWQTRASLVAFIRVADRPAYYPLIERGCRALIQREERFAKTAVGWILRDISKHDVDFVRRVIEEQLEFFSTESLRNATRHLSKKQQKAYRQRLKRR